ncbi:MAG TPA: ABC transporter ATP-binding protein, partial [Rhabdochlamydiaceae bacterium]
MNSKNLFSFISGFLKTQRWKFGFIFLLSLLWAMEMLFWPYLLRKIVDILTLYDIDRLSAWPFLKTLLIWGAGGIFFIEVGFRTRDYIAAKAFPQLESDIRMAMFDHVQRHSPKYFNEHFAGSLANKIGDMISSITTMLRNVFMLFIPACLICVLTILIFAQMNSFLALIVGMWILLHFTLTWIFTIKCAKYSHIHGEVRSTLMGKIVDSLTNNFVVNLFYRFRFEKDQIAHSQKEELKTNDKAQVYSVKMFTAMSVGFVIEIFILTGFAISYWLHGKISTGEIVQLFYTVWNLGMVIWVTSDKGPEFFQSLGIAKQALSIMQDPQDILDPHQAIDLVVNKGEIVFENVSFCYGERKVFQNKSLRIS